MKQEKLVLTQNTRLAQDVYKMVLKGKNVSECKPGQFVNLALQGFFLRRPISVCDCTEDTLTLIYKAVGEGTEFMSGLKTGEEIDTLLGLGKGFDISRSGKKPLLIGGGVGTPPMYYLAKELIAAGKKPTAALGFASAADVFLVEELEALGVKTLVATVDGSFGEKGFVTNLFDKIDFDFFYACGPMPMLEAICKTTDIDGQLSFEERMGCGFGACMGCSRMTKGGTKKICKDGPVFDREEIIW